MESADLPEGVERVEKIDDYTYRVYDTDGSVHTVRYVPDRDRSVSYGSSKVYRRRR